MVTGHDPQVGIVAGLGQGEGSLALGHRALGVAMKPGMEGQIISDAPEPAPVVESFRQDLGLAEELEHPRFVAERQECGAQIEAEIDGRLALDAGERALEAGRRVPVVAPCQGGGAGTPQLLDRRLSAPGRLGRASRTRPGAPS